MVQVQKWLDQNYPEEERGEISEIYLNDPNLEGEVSLSDFTCSRGVKVCISQNLNENNLTIINKLKQVEIIKLVNAQEWLDQNYPRDKACRRETKDFNEELGEMKGWNNHGKTRAEITKLDISGQGLEGFLDLRNFVNLIMLQCGDNFLTNLKLSNCLNLTTLACWNNELTGLDIANNQQLTDLWCSDNKLKELDLSSNSKLSIIDCSENQLANLNYSTLNPNKLRWLTIMDNDLSDRDLTVFSQFVSLEWLEVGNFSKERIKKNTYNRWHGSLRPLKKLSKLRELDISNTDISSGVQFLPDNLKFVRYNTKERPKSKVREIAWKLDLFNNKSQKNWEGLGFTLAEIKIWIEVGVKAEEYDFADYLKKQKKLLPREAMHNLSKLRAEYREYKDPSWQYIHSDFTPNLQSEWKKEGFNGPQTEKWIKQGKLWPEETGLVKYLKEIGIPPEEVGEKPAKYRRKYNELLELQVQKLQKVRTNFNNQEVEINYLETRIKELINLIGTQKSRLFTIFERLLPKQKEKLELIKNLVVTHLEFTKAKKQRVPSVTLRGQRDKIRDELEKKLGGNFAEEIQLILSECEELVEQELELENILNRQTLLLEKQNKILQINFADLKLENLTFLHQNQIIELKKTINKKVGKKDEEMINKTNAFLEVKRIFLDDRRGTIKKLQDCYNRLESKISGGIYDDVGNMISKLGGIVKVIGEIIGACSTFFQKNFVTKKVNEFQKILVKDKNNLSNFDEIYNSLIKFIRKNKDLEITSTIVCILNLEGRLERKEVRLFNTKHKVFDIIIKDGVWENGPLTIEKMGNSIVSLNKNLEKLKSELEEEENQFNKKFKKFDLKAISL